MNQLLQGGWEPFAVGAYDDVFLRRSASNANAGVADPPPALSEEMSAEVRRLISGTER